MVIITKANIKDIESMSQLLDELFTLEEDFQPNQEKQIKGLELLIEQMKLDNSSCNVLVAKDNNSVIGMCSIQRLISTASGGYKGLIEDVIVDKKYRNAGVGEKLISEIISWAMKNNYNSIYLLADKKNIDAHRFYKRNGFEIGNLINLNYIKK